MTVQSRRGLTARSALVVVFVVSLVVAMATAPPAVAQESDEPAFVHPDLQQQVAEADAGDGSMLAVAVVEGSADVSAVAGDPRAVAGELQDFAQSAQAGVKDQIAALDTGAIRVANQLWILNAMVVELSPTEDTLNQLAALDGVERVVPNYELSVGEPEEGEPATVDDRTYGIDVIQAHEVWDQLGIQGDGVRVATLDTGVDIDHPDLEGKMVTDDPDDPTYPGGWMEFGPDGNLVSSEPYDSSDHGTHVAGTIHGEDNHPDGIQIGVAPASDMMHGLVIPGGEGDFGQVAAGMQWAIDPTDADGEPAGEPADVVNMSLGASDYIAEMIEPTQNMRDAGIFPAFSSGNTGFFGDCRPGEGNVGSGSPGNVYEAVAVGATGVNDDVADFSCGEWIDTFDPGYWGDDAPEEWPDEYVVPDVSAPGVDVLSALPEGNWGNYSGTSMAAPHVAGTAALMLSASPGESVDFMQETLEATSFWDDRHYEERPDRRFGHGRINALEAVQQVAIDSGVEGTVTGPDGPIEGATVTVGDSSVDTDEGGEYQLRLEPGEYDVTAEAFGFETETAEAVTVTEEEFTEQNFDLNEVATGEITGEVTDADTNVGVEDVPITVADGPFSAETDADGDYTISGVPEGEWTVHASPDGYADPEPQQVTVVEGEPATADFVLEPLPPAVGVAGDFDGLIGAFLDENDIPNEPYTWDDDPSVFPVVLVNRPGDPGEEVFSEFINDAEAAGTGVVLLDTWAAGGNGIELAHLHLDNPEVRETSFASSIDELSYEVTETHPIVGSAESGDSIPFDTTTQWKDHAWFDEYTGDAVTLIADAAADGEVLGRGIAAKENDGNRHALLSMHGASTDIGPNDWAEESAEVFLNAIEWVWAENAEIAVDPSSLSATVAEGDSTDETLTVSSTGEDTLEWEIETAEADGAVVDLATEAGIARADADTVDREGIKPAPQRVESSDVGVYEESFTEGFDDIDTLPDDGWDMINNSDPLGLNSWFQGNPDVFESHEGGPDSYIGANFQNAGEPAPAHISNWLLTPTVALNDGDEFSFWTRSSEEDPEFPFYDRLEVRLSTAGDSDDVGDDWDSVGDFDTLMLTINEDLEPGEYPQEWTEYTVTIEDVPADTDGRLAFRYSVEDSGPAGNDGDYIGIDTFEYAAAEPDRELESIEVEPDEASVVAGSSVELTATAHYDDGHEADVTGAAEWDSSNVDVASVDAGVVTGVSEGEAVITAELEGHEDTAEVTVDPLVGCEAPVGIDWLDVDPAAGSTDPGDSAEVTVSFDAAELTEGSYEAVLCVISNAANQDLVEVPVELTVEADDPEPPPEDPVALEVTPDEVTVGVDGVVQLEATAVYEDGTEAPVTDEAEWVSADTDVATVDAGLVAGVAEGDTEVTATFEDLSDSASVTVDAEVEPGPVGLERISAEPGRVEVAIAASQHRFGDGEAGAVVLARADEYPDALAGTTLAAEVDAPLLLTSSDQLLDHVADEVARVLGEDGVVYLTGGTAALDDTVEDAVDGLGYDLTRLGGQTRFETAGLIASELGERSQVLVTTGLDFPDALTAGAAAAAHDGVVLLSADEDPHEVVDDYLEEFEGEVTAVGGPATRAYPDAEAVMGQTRDETAVAVAEVFFDEPAAFGVARRDDYPDALAGGAHIAAYEGPLLLSYTEDVPEETAQWLTETDATGGFVYGGTAAISEDTFDQLEDLAFE